MQHIATAEKEVSYQSTLLLDTYQKWFRMPGGFGKLLKPLCKIYGLSSICVAVGLASVFFGKNGFRVRYRTTEVCGPKNNAANMIVCNESLNLWQWDMAGRGNDEVLTQESVIERVSAPRELEK